MPLFALLFNLSAQQILILLATLLFGTPVLNCMAAIMTALTLNIPQGSLLLTLLLLPLFMPILILSILCFNAGISVLACLSLLLAILLITLCFAPLAVNMALRLSVCD